MIVVGEAVVEAVVSALAAAALAGAAIYCYVRKLVIYQIWFFVFRFYRSIYIYI